MMKSYCKKEKEVLYYIQARQTKQSKLQKQKEKHKLLGKPSPYFIGVRHSLLYYTTNVTIMLHFIKPIDDISLQCYNVIKVV